ncbi:MAG: hypothetical protein A3J93_00460 [Candidatus Magasanikbacteria bacterium RIFOXYC2_FULL_42_28]|uniref:Transketolase-like pyrimidine-binding domain-containing protein n=1 Tax=Candidatus Magasanikbacteria bacterium RIFOXYC2_FULL_42_28 TaxID=1798704 RepID=A0A1F6NWL2_9BACT|nr:MAG: hypothetical protein A3J93_00460 [Candidatus Magasanikbacteria bacterium RIFOXYC2_FULL_42_28]
MAYNILEKNDWEKLKTAEPARFENQMAGGEYLNLQKLDLAVLPGIDTDKLNDLARIMRGFIFAMVEAARSGHPGSSAKAEMLLAMVLSGVMGFNPLDPKNNGRDRLIWSAGHCTPALYAILTVIYESLKLTGQNFDEDKLHAVLAKHLHRFRRPDGPQGHVEAYSPLADFGTGPSGHGLSGASGMAAVHKSCGLDTKVFVIMGDAESEEGMSYEARNVAVSLGQDNLIVNLDYNHFGIDGDINEVIATPYINHWLGLGWNVIEVNGHDVLELVYAYRKASEGFGNKRPTCVLAHAFKGKGYGKMENTAESHGTPAKFPDYVEIMKKLGFDIPGVEKETTKDIEVVLKQLTPELAQYVCERLKITTAKIKPESELITKMTTALTGRAIVNPTDIKRPETLPTELVFEQGANVATRKATQAWFDWLMKQTAFFYAGAGDLAKSVLTAKAENVYGVITPNNPLGRGVRFGIAEQNMAMFGTAITTDRLPGGFAPVSVFASYGVFTSMMTNCVRLTLINNHLYPEHKGFFIVLAAHDGPETGEDGPTHQGMFWMSMYNAYPGIKVYKPMDANETIEMLFYALEKGEPIALSVARPDTVVFKRGNGVPEAREAVNGAYVFKNYSENGGRKIALAICGAQVLANTLEIVPELEAGGLDVKIIAVTSPELYEDLRKTNPTKANEICSDEDRARVVAMHNGWKGFLYPFLLPSDYDKRTIAIDTYLTSGNPKEVYEVAGFTAKDLLKKIINSNLK